jgi:hypothetical protein
MILVDMLGPHPRVDEGHADACSSESPKAGHAGPHLVCADGWIGHRHERGDLNVARKVRPRRFVGERVELGSVDVEHGAFVEALVDREILTRRDRIDFLRHPTHITLTEVVGIESTWR